MKLKKIFSLEILVSFLLALFSIPRASSSTISQTNTPWISLSKNAAGPRHLVDSSGKPFYVFGMARCQACENDESQYGDAYDLANHFKNLGCNTMRLAVSSRKDTKPGVDLVEECGGWNEAGMNKFIDKYVEPDLRAIISIGMYVILDLHEYPPNQTNPVNPADIVAYARNRYIPMWKLLAQRYANEPMIIMFELWNEPYPAVPMSLSLGADGKVSSGPYAGYDWNTQIRQFYIDCVSQVRQYDTKHVLLLSDYNAGWGTAWGTTWGSNPYIADPVYKNIIFSVHAAAQQLQAQYTYFSNYWKDISTNNNIALHFGEIETEDYMATNTSMQNLVNYLSSSKSTHHFPAILWRPHDDVSNYVSIWNGFAKTYTSYVDTQANTFEAEDALDPNFEAVSDVNAFSLAAVQLKASTAQWSYGTISLKDYVAAPDNYLLRVRSFGASTKTAPQALYYKTIGGSHKLIASLPVYTDNKYHENTYLIQNPLSFTGIVVKKTSAKNAPGNPIDRVVLTNNTKIEAEYAYPQSILNVQNNNDASGGMIAGLNASTPQYGFVSLGDGAYHSPGKYTVTLRMRGAPTSNANLSLHYKDWEGVHRDIGWITSKTTSGYYFVSFTFTSTMPWQELILKKTSAIPAATNSVDYIRIDRQ